MQHDYLDIGNRDPAFSSVLGRCFLSQHNDELTMGVARPFLLLCLLAILASAHLSHADERHEPEPQLQQKKCSKLLTRKEWRTLTSGEKAEWVGAVKVRPPFSPSRLHC